MTHLKEYPQNSPTTNLSIPIQKHSLTQSNNKMSTTTLNQAPVPTIMTTFLNTIDPVDQYDTFKALKSLNKTYNSLISYDDLLWALCIGFKALHPKAVEIFERESRGPFYLLIQEGCINTNKLFSILKEFSAKGKVKKLPKPADIITSTDYIPAICITKIFIESLIMTMSDQGNMMHFGCWLLKLSLYLEKFLVE